MEDSNNKEDNGATYKEHDDHGSSFYSCNDSLRNGCVKSCNGQPGLKAMEVWEDEDDESNTQVEKKFVYLDAFLAKWCEWSSKSYLTDRGLKLLQWTLWYLSHYYRNKKKEILGSSLRKLYLDVSNTRYMLRLYGLPTALEAIRTGSWSGGNQWKNRWIYRLADISAWSMLLYYPLEHAAFATWMMPRLLNHHIDAAKASARSCRFWLIFIICDWISSYLKNKELKQKLMAAYEKNETGSISSCSTSNHTNTIDVKAIEKSISLNRLQMIRNALFTLPCINWSLPKWETDPWLSEVVVNGLMWGESIVCFHQSIRSCQKD